MLSSLNKHKSSLSFINNISKLSKKYRATLLKHQIKNQMREQRIQRICQKRNKLLQKKKKRLTKKIVKLKKFNIISNTKNILNIILS